VGTYQRAADNTALTLRAAHVRAGSQTYIVAGVAPSAEFSSVEATFARAIGSFRSLSEAEAERVQPSRVDFRIARAGDSWESLARDVAKGTVTPDSLAIMNGRDVTTPPRSRERLRIVIGG
jgi:predicted Zn-dependent protease